MYSLPFLFLAFFTYHGVKAILVPFVLVSVIAHYATHKDKKLIKLYGLLLVFSLILVGYFASSFRHQAATQRNKEILFFNKDLIASGVNKERLQSIPSPFQKIFSNKLAFIVKEFINRYMGAFSVPYLFNFGDATGVRTHTFWVHGLFYYIDWLFLMIGFAALFSKKRRTWVILSLLLLIAPLGRRLMLIAGHMFTVQDYFFRQ